VHADDGVEQRGTSVRLGEQTIDVPDHLSRVGRVLSDNGRPGREADERDLVAYAGRVGRLGNGAGERGERPAVFDDVRVGRLAVVHEQRDIERLVRGDDAEDLTP